MSLLICKMIIQLSPTVLVVEDEPLMLKALCAKLKLEGFPVLEAKDGEEGLNSALVNHPDIILLDLHMPKMDGMTMMHKLRTDGWGKNVPIIILTNYDTKDQNLLEVITDQPSYYLMKADTPIEDVLVKIREVLESKKEEV